LADLTVLIIYLSHSCKDRQGFKEIRIINNFGALASLREAFSNNITQETVAASTKDWLTLPCFWWDTAGRKKKSSAKALLAVKFLSHIGIPVDLPQI
jgi:predicted DNA-binding ArsR family transcriptional regulator